MKKILGFLLAFFVSVSGQSAQLNGLGNDELEKALNYAIDSTMYWSDTGVPPEIMRSIKESLGKQIFVKMYSRESKEVVKKKEYFFIFESLKIKSNDAVLRVQIWPKTSEKYVFDVSMNRQNENEFNGYDIQKKTFELSKDWSGNAASFDAEYEKEKPLLFASFGKYFSQKGLKGTQKLFVGPFSKWSNEIIVYWSNVKTFYGLHCCDFDAVTFNACVKKYGHGIKNKKITKQWIANCINGGKVLEIVTP